MPNIKSLAQIVSEIWPKQVFSMKVAPLGDKIVNNFSLSHKESMRQISSL